MKAFAEKIQNGLRPGRGVIATGVSRNPSRSGFLHAGAKVSGGQGIEPAARDAELIGSLKSFQSALSKGFQHIPDEGRRVTADKLLVIFRTWSIPCRPVPAASLFVGLRYAPASSKTGGGVDCPALLTTQLVLLCSHRDISLFPARAFAATTLRATSAPTNNH